jgi:hypothetical protein
MGAFGSMIFGTTERCVFSAPRCRGCVTNPCAPATTKTAARSEVRHSVRERHILWTLDTHNGLERCQCSERWASGRYGGRQRIRSLCSRSFRSATAYVLRMNKTYTGAKGSGLSELVGRCHSAFKISVTWYGIVEAGKRCARSFKVART